MENTVLKCVQWFLSFPVGGSNWKIVGFGALTFRGMLFEACKTANNDTK